MPNPKKEIRDFRNMTVNFEEAAKFLNLSKSSFYCLIKTGVIPKAGEGEYILGEVVDSYWRNQFCSEARHRHSEGLKAAQTRLVTAQAELKEAELAENRGELHRASAIAKVWTDQVLNAKTHLLAIPTKVGLMLVGQELQVIVKKLKDAIYEALRELADYDWETIRLVLLSQRNQ